MFHNANVKQEKGEGCVLANMLRWMFSCTKKGD